MSNIVNQQTIRDWFEDTYKKKGKKYLRPPEAYEIFMKYLNVEPGKKLLDTACGPGLLLDRAIRRGTQTYGIDISAEAIRMSQEFVPEANTQNGNAESLPYESNFFDYLTCLGSLERMLDLDKVLAEQYRVGKPSATYCYMVRNSRNITWRMTEKTNTVNDEAHQGAKNIEEWSNIFQQSGFSIKHIYADHWPTMRWPHWLNKILFGLTPIDYTANKHAGNPGDAYELVFLLGKV